jgi:tRNA dimethylallyltransferase
MESNNIDLNNFDFKDFVIIISGPTASGKSDLAEKIAEFVPSEIINADIGQFYRPFFIGTAKPDWQNKKTKHHLFDILDEPENISVVKYKKLIDQKIKELWDKKKIPILVGGSLFYLKSLYFPPQKYLGCQDNVNIIYNENLWETLNKIDPKRASQLHPNDLYRVKRALDIWQKTGMKPSEFNPEFNPFFNSFFIYVDLDKNVLHQKINKRTGLMLKQGWIQEVQDLVGTKWEPFFAQKGLIGYKEIADWLNSGKEKDLKEVENDIATQTRQYAKRQKVFWNSFKQQLLKNEKKSGFSFIVNEISNVDESINHLLIENIKKEIKNFCCR